MYESFYHLKEKPFSLLPDPHFLFHSEKHDIALAKLEYGLMNHVGFTVISGGIGTGKTTLIRHILNNLEQDLVVGLITNTHESFGDLMEWICAAFSLPVDDTNSITLFQQFMDFIIQQYAEGRRTALIVDEAQNMSVDTLEKLRVLSNVNSDKDQVLQIILVGQDELEENLRRPELVQFAQRIAVHHALTALTGDETAAYIRHRLTVAGGNASLFEPEAMVQIHRYSGGVPRLINVLCDLAMVYGFAAGRSVITAALVHEAARDKEQGGLLPLAASVPENIEEMIKAEKHLDSTPVPDEVDVTIDHVKDIPEDETTSVVEKREENLLSPAEPVVAINIDEVTPEFNEAPAVSSALKPKIPYGKIVAGVIFVLAMLSVATYSFMTQDTQSDLTQPVAIESEAEASVMQQQAANVEMPKIEQIPLDHSVATLEEQEEIERLKVASNKIVNVTPVVNQKTIFEEVDEPVKQDFIKSADIHGTAWIAGLDKNKYTLHVASMNSKNRAYEFIREHGIENSAAYFASSKDTIIWHSVMFGVYPTFQDAKNAIQSLPVSLSSSKPWVRKISRINWVMIKDKD